MKYCLFLIGLYFLTACAGEQTDTTVVEEEGTATEMATDADVQQMTEETLKNLSAYRSDVEKKLEEVIEAKKSLLAVDDIPAEAKEGVEAAIRVTEQMERQVDNWLGDAALIQSQADTSDVSSFQPLLDRSAETGAYYSKQLEQVKRMVEGQLKRVKGER
jgi:hypothetical protein